MSKGPRDRKETLSDLKAFAEANCAAQNKLKGELTRLESGPATAAGHRRMVQVKADLITLGIALNVRCQQENLRA
jgi:hypothetical protein